LARKRDVISPTQTARLIELDELTPAIPSESGQYLAIKALRHEHSTRDNPEMNILRKLGKLEVAFLYTPKGMKKNYQFLCLGLKPLGCTLRERFNAYVDAPVDLPSLNILVKTLLRKVLGFHQKGICHGGT
jgi:hypothetical protein